MRHNATSPKGGLGDENGANALVFGLTLAVTISALGDEGWFDDPTAVLQTEPVATAQTRTIAPPTVHSVGKRRHLDRKAMGSEGPGQHAAARAVCERCGKSLQSVAGVEPSPETQALYRALHVPAGMPSLEHS